MLPAQGRTRTRKRLYAPDVAGNPSIGSHPDPDRIQAFTSRALVLVFVLLALPKPCAPSNLVARIDSVQNMQVGVSLPEFKQQTFRKFNTERKKEMESDSSRLLKLAADLNTELSAADTEPSILELHNLDKIQKLARRVKSRMNFVLAEGSYH